MCLVCLKAFGIHLRRKRQIYAAEMDMDEQNNAHFAPAHANNRNRPQTDNGTELTDISQFKPERAGPEFTRKEASRDDSPRASESIEGNETKQKPAGTVRLIHQDNVMLPGY